MGELAGADILVDPAELELDPASEAELADGVEHRPAQLRDPARVRGTASRAEAAESSGFASGSRRSRSSARSASRRSRSCSNRLEPDGKGSVRAVATDERETIPCGIVFRSVGYHGVPLPGCRSTREAGRSRTRRPRSRRRGRADSRRLRRRLDQARPDGRHRDEQEGRDRDRRAPARGRARGRSAPHATAERDIEELLAERGVEAVMYAGWEAIDALERCPRRAPGPSARQALHLGRAAGRRPRLDSPV